MKSNFSSRVIRFFLIVNLVITYASMLLWSQERTSNEILVYVKPNTINVPLDQEPNINLTSESIKSPDFLSLLERYQIREVKRAFAHFNLADTLKYSPDGEPIAMLNLSRLFKIIIPPPYDRDSVVAAFSRLPEVIFAEKNGGWKLHTNDPHYTKQWYLKNTGQSGGTAGADIKVENAWQIFTGSSQMKIGIIDSGIKTNHEDLSGKVSGDNPDYNWHDPNWYNSYSHGTHVGGIAGSKTGNGLGIAGVDQNTQIYSRRIFDSENHQNDDVFIYNAILDAVNQGCKILNNSWGGSNYSTTIRYGFAYAYKMNRVAVVSMGNWNGNQTQYPAGFGQGIIAVGSTTDNDVVSVFSNTGNHIDVSAPGGSGTGNTHDIFSTVAYSTSYGYYDYLAGTSMAAPVVTGVTSLLKGYNSNLYNDDIEQIIRISTDDKGDPGWDQYYGTGRVNAYKALMFLQAPYQLSQLSAFGGQDYSVTDYYPMIIWGASGLADASYIVKRHEVRKNVTFSAVHDYYAWGRGVGSTGWSNTNPNFTMGFCEIIPGTLTSTSATLRTYVYEVWSFSEYLGYHPTTPQNATFKYTVLGKPVVAPIIDHFVQTPNPICKGGSGSVTAYLSQGSPTPTYTWTKIDGPASFEILNSTGNPCQVRYNNTGMLSPDDVTDAVIRCVATNGGGSYTKNYIVELVNECPSCPTLAFNVEGEMTDDNPMLITSLSNPGVDVTDYYLIQNSVTPVGNKINLRIHEPQTEHTWLDYVELIEAKVKSDELVAMNDEGEVINYKNNTAPVTVLLNGTTDITEILSSMDTLDIDLNEGDIITIQRNIQAPENDGDGDLVLGGIDPIKDQESITLSLTNKEDIEGENSKLGDLTFFFRPNKSIIAKKLRNLPPGNLEITINRELTLNYLTIVRNIKTARVNSLGLLSANHQHSGDVKNLLLGIDQNYAEIFPGDMINFVFQKGTIPAEKIEYILKSVGRYETDTTSALNKLAGTGEENLIPKENKLYDNYPNPFNPITQIKYSVKENGLVTLKVYDILGKEVAALVNEEKQAGTYTVTFDARSMASGIYFYTISANDYQKTKKMILIK